MPNNQLDALITEARDQSIQERATRQEVFGSNVIRIEYLAAANDIIAPWWSTTRDRQLRQFWKKVDYLAGAIFNMTSKMSAIPVKIVPRDISIKAHVEQADRMTEAISNAAEFGDGWVTFYSRWVEELNTQDNGAFGEVIGFGRPDGPIIGQPLSFAHLDSFRCVRTGSAEFSVVYQDTDGALYKLHYTRVIYASQMSSPIAEMFGVGYCAVSRCVNISQHLLDILIYQQEKLGSRPLREIILTTGGLDPQDMMRAFEKTEEKMDALGLRRYAKMIIGGSATLPEADIKRYPLTTTPDGFDYETDLTLGMAAIALALGMDARELFPQMGVGATRADALIQHLKQRGKGPGQIMQTTEKQFDAKFLPPHLRTRFDYQDDAEDRQIADIRKVRADRRLQDTTTGSMSPRILREQMFQDGDIDASQFERMELEDGRLSDGTSVLALFYKRSGDYTQYLDLEVDDPLDIEGNNADTLLKTIHEKQREALKTLANDTSLSKKDTARQAIAALIHLEKRYQTMNLLGEPLDQIPAKPPGQGGEVDPRLRTTDNLSPSARSGNDRQVRDAQAEATRGHPTDDRVAA